VVITCYLPESSGGGLVIADQFAARARGLGEAFLCSMSKVGAGQSR